MTDSHTTHEVFFKARVPAVKTYSWRRRFIIFFQSVCSRCCLQRGWSKVTSIEDVSFPITRFRHASHSCLGRQMYCRYVHTLNSKISSYSNDCNYWPTFLNVALPIYQALNLPDSLYPGFSPYFNPFSPNSLVVKMMGYKKTMKQCTSFKTTPLSQQNKRQAWIH